MNNQLVKITWTLDSSEADTELESKTSKGESIFINYEGVTEVMRDLIEDCGSDLFDESDYNTMLGHIEEDLYPKKISLSDAIRNIGYVHPRRGEFILVFNITAHRSNNFDDPEEWDMNVESLGILGEQVKIVRV